MKQNYLKNLLFTFSLIVGISFSWAQTETFNYTGSVQTYTVPVGVSSVQIEAWGAEGGTGTYSGITPATGLGGYSIGSLAVTPGEVLNVYVGGQGATSGAGGYNGGGPAGTSYGASGGGASDVRQAPYTLSDRKIVAGGGGGASFGSYPSYGGDGGALNGEAGQSNGGYTGGGGGSQVAGGTAGCCYGVVTAGSFGIGGGTGAYHNGGGGGGWYGGGGGSAYGAAGGGSSYIDGLADASTTGGVNEGHGQVVITVLCIPLTEEFEITGVCLGDEITLDVSSETGGTISWDGGIVNGTPFIPAPGSTIYTASSTSPDDCAYSVEVTASAVPDIEGFSSLPAACEGATITVWGEGGDTYVWTGSGGFDPTDNVPFLAEDGVVTYTLDGSYMGCHADPIDITLVGSPQPDVIGVATPSEVCMGDSYTVTGTGSGAESYYWGGGIADGGTITPEGAGTYIHMIIGVSDAGCYDTAFTTVVVYANPMITAGSDVTVCEGNEVTLTATGTDSYAWTPSITNGVPFTPADLGLTVYTVIGTDVHGCTDEESVNVTVLDKPVIESVTVVDEFEINNGSIDITVTGGSGEYTYEWSNGAFTEDIYGLSSGLYTVVINDITIIKGMCPTDGGYTIKSYLGVESEDQISMLVYPNPTTDMITVMVEGQFNYELTNLLGDVILTGTAYNQEELSLNELATGTYLVRVTSGDKINVIQIVKN